MCKGLLGKKLGMMGFFLSSGEHIPVTVLQVGPCVVTQIKSKATDGYSALQIGFLPKKESRINKPLKGHFKKSGKDCFAYLREFGVDEPEKYSLGQNINAENFQVGEWVDVSGTTKGRGFAGGIKRHGFHGGDETHGCKCHRIPGSMGSSTYPGRVFKGKRMPGHLGNDRRTVRNLKIVDIRPEQNLIFIKGAIPGPASGVVEIRKTI